MAEQTQAGPYLQSNQAFNPIPGLAAGAFVGGGMSALGMYGLTSAGNGIAKLNNKGLDKAADNKIKRLKKAEVSGFNKDLKKLNTQIKKNENKINKEIDKNFNHLAGEVDGTIHHKEKKEHRVKHLNDRVHQQVKDEAKKRYLETSIEHRTNNSSVDEDAIRKEFANKKRLKTLSGGRKAGIIGGTALVGSIIGGTAGVVGTRE